MKSIVLCSALGLSGALVAMIAQGCSSSSSSPTPEDSGAPVQDSGTPTTDTGAPSTDSGTPADTGAPNLDSGNAADTNPTVVDAGQWVPSNFAVSALAGLTPVAVDVAETVTANSHDGTWNFNTTTAPATPPSATVTLSGAGGNATVWYLSSLTVEAGQQLNIEGDKPAIFYVTGPVQIDGAIVVTAGTLTNGAGAGASGVTTSGNVPLGGGGGGGFCAAGGSGSAFDGGAANAGGQSYGTANLIPLVGGSLGGTSNNGPGGAGGGAFQITSTASIAIVAGGSILAGGLGGGSGNAEGAGGGSGGSLLLEAPSVANAGNLSVNGGSGGDANNDGNPATINATPAIGGGNGGSGAAAGTATGGNGGTPGAAGGGGAGRIRINATTPTLGGIITPSVGDAGDNCVTTGSLPTM